MAIVCCDEERDVNGTLRLTLAIAKQRVRGPRHEVIQEWCSLALQILVHIVNAESEGASLRC